MRNKIKEQELSHEETEELLNYFSRDLLTKFVRLGSKGYCYLEEMMSVVSDIYNMEVRPSDCFIVTFPRSGTTWTQELMWLLQNDLDFEKAKATPLTIRFPMMESAAFSKLKFPIEMTRTENFEKFKEETLSAHPDKMKDAPSPRFIKTHLPLSLAPPALLDTAKVVYVARDPRDVAVSNFYHLRSFQIIPQDADFKTFWKFFLENKIPRAPYFEHIKEAWRQRDHPNMTFIFYEELSKDLAGVAKRLAKFYGKEYSEEQFDALCNHLKFDNFKNNESVNPVTWNKTGVLLDKFIRKGKPGGWRDHFDEEMTRQAELWIEKNLRDTDLRFPRVD